MFVHHFIKSPKCYEATIALVFGAENKYESLLYQPPVDKLRKLIPRAPLIMFLSTAPVTGDLTRKKPAFAGKPTFRFSSSVNVTIFHIKCA